MPEVEQAHITVVFNSVILCGVGLGNAVRVKGSFPVGARHPKNVQIKVSIKWHMFTTDFSISQFMPTEQA